MSAPAPFDGHPIAPQTRAFLDRAHKLPIDGAWVDRRAGETMATRDPAVSTHFRVGKAVRVVGLQASPIPSLRSWLIAAAVALRSSR